MPGLREEMTRLHVSPFQGSQIPEWFALLNTDVHVASGPRSATGRPSGTMG